MSPAAQIQAPLLAALNGRNAGPPPVWMMRQAGRTLASYKALRGGRTFLDFCKDPRAAGTATLLPVREMPVDAAILFADILLPLEAWGHKIRFVEGEGPHVDPPLRDGTPPPRAQWRDIREVCGYVGDTIRHVKQELPAEVPLIGFCPAPFTLAAYLVQGRGVAGFPALKALMYNHPAQFDRLLGDLTELLIDYSAIMLDAGVAAFQVFDTWAELLPPQRFRDGMVGHLRRLLNAVEGVPRIYFPKGSAQHLDAAWTLPCEAISCDWTVDLPAVRQRYGHDKALQGNLDPAVLYAEPPAIERETHALLDGMAGDPGFVLNLGHGLRPDIPEAHVKAFVAAVKAWTPTA